MTTQTTINEAGVKHIYSFDDNMRQVGVEIIHPADAECAMDVEEKLHKSKKTYWNLATQSFVSYARARQLKIDTDNEPPIYPQC